MRFLAVFLFFATAVSAEAEQLPAQYNVNNVADDDRLNIRSGPNANSEILSSYGPYTINIEVLETTADGKWGKVGIGERNGWVSMAFLTRDANTDPNEIPRPMSCFGTEPFWSFNMTPRGDEILTPDTPRKDIEPTDLIIADNGYFIEFDQTHRLLISRGMCSDGMSDREFGWRSTAIFVGAYGSTVAHGCCTLDGAN